MLGVTPAMTYPTFGSAACRNVRADDCVRTVVRAPPSKGGRRNPPDVFQGCDWFPLSAASWCRMVVTWSSVKVGMRTTGPAQLARITPEEE